MSLSAALPKPLNSRINYVREEAAYVIFAAYVAIGLLDEFGFNTLASLFESQALSNVLFVAKSAIVASAFLLSLFRQNGLNIWQTAMAGLAACLFFLSGELSTASFLLYNLVIFFMIAECRLDRLCKIYFIVCATTIAILFLLTSLNLGYNRDEMPNGRLVFAYGLRHPNSAGALLLSAMCAMTFYSWNKKSWSCSLIMSAIAAIFSYLTLSSNASAALLALLCALTGLGHIRLVARFADSHRTALALFAVLTVLLLFLLMLLGTVFYTENSSFWTVLDGLTHGRVMHSNAIYRQEGDLTLFGRFIASASYYHSGQPFNALDSGYCRLVLIYGLLPAIALYLIYLMATLRNTMSSNYFCIISIFIIYALHLLIETHGLNLYACSALIFLSACFSEENQFRPHA